MRGSERVKNVVRPTDTLEIDSLPDQNEFTCYQNSFFSTNFHLPITKLCFSACAPVPLQPGTWIITELIESTGMPGDFSHPFLENGLQKKLYWQLKVSLMTIDLENPKWKLQDLTSPFVYSCDDSTLKIDVDSVKIEFQRADLDIFSLKVSPELEFFLTASDLKQLKLPKGSTNHEFFAKNLAIYQDSKSKWKLYNP